MKWCMNEENRNAYFAKGICKEFHKKVMHSQNKISQQTPLYGHELNVGKYNVIKTIPIDGIEDSHGSKCVSLVEAFRQRRSVWEFDGLPLEKDDFLFFLKQSMGTNEYKEVQYINGEGKSEIAKQSLRAYPSGGALYPIQIYIYVHKVNGIEAGVYKYIHGKKDALEKISKADEKKIDQFTSFQFDKSKKISNANMLIFLATDLDYSTRYGLLQYKLSLLEAGHIAENICLMAVDMGWHVIPIGGFYEEKLNQFLTIHQNNETVLYFLGVG